MNDSDDVQHWFTLDTHTWDLMYTWEVKGQLCVLLTESQCIYKHREQNGITYYKYESQHDEYDLEFIAK